MRSTFKLINSYFWKTFYGPILSFIFPIILLGILGNIFRVEYVYPGIIAMSFLFIGLLSLPLTIMELKQSSLFKYIGSSPVNPIKFTLVVIGFYVFVAIITSFIILAATMAIFHNDVFVPSGFKNGILGGIFSWPGSASFYISTGVHLLFVIVCGLLISTISKTPQQSLTVGLIILIPSIFLSGMILSVDIIAQSPALNWISRLIPFRYSTGNIIIASTPADQIGDMFQTLEFDQKVLLFNKDQINADGSVTFYDFVHGQRVVHSMKELEDARNVLGENIYKGVADRTLFDLTLGEALDQKAASSDNNIFNWINSWSVRRIPQVESIKEFIKKYFASFSSGTGKADWSKLTKPGGFADQISAGKFGWLEIFMKQTNVLYEKADRVLNLMLPLTLTAGGVWYIGTNFQWSAR